jgi:diaminopimelate decarboxylase
LKRLLNLARYSSFFRYRRGRLWCESAPVERIAAQVGTPAYVYSRAGIEAAFRDYRRAFGSVPHAICYSVKANSNLSVLRILARLGSYFDIVSGGELYRLSRIGVPGNRVVFSGVGKTRDEIRDALRASILLFNVESEEELVLLAEEASRLRRAAPAALRINPDVGIEGHPHVATGTRRHKFGVDWEEARRLYLAYRSHPAIRWRGISSHIGSQILRVEPFRVAVRRVARFVRELEREGIRLSFFDCGGGLGVRYISERPPSLRSYVRALAQAVRPTGCRLLLEPGRSLVGPAGVLLTRVLYTKRTRSRRFVIVDAAMNDFIRPALYGARHPITPAVDARAGRGIIRADVVGPVCESGDSFLHDWLMPTVNHGDLLVLWGAGAYGVAQASNYNSRPRPPEVLVEGSHFRVIRRRETREDLIRGE